MTISKLSLVFKHKHLHTIRLIRKLFIISLELSMNDKTEHAFRRTFYTSMTRLLQTNIYNKDYTVKYLNKNYWFMVKYFVRNAAEQQGSVSYFT